MSATVHLKKLPVSRNSGVRFPNVANFELSEEVIENVRVPDNLDVMSSMTLDLESDKGECNYIVIENSGITYWWVESYEPVANRDGVLRFILARDPWPEMADRRVYGSFDRLPYQTMPSAPIRVKTDTLCHKDTLSLPGTVSFLTNHIGVVQIVYVQGSTQMAFHKAYFLVNLNAPDLGVKSKTGDISFPSLNHIISNPSVMVGVSSENLIDVSVTFISPFYIKQNAIENRAWITDSSGTPAATETTAGGALLKYDETVVKFCFTGWSSKHFHLDNFRPGIDELDLYDYNGNLLSVIPSELHDPRRWEEGKSEDNPYPLNLMISTCTVCDIYGFITYIAVGHSRWSLPDTAPAVYVMHHGKLPITSSAWQDYAYNQLLYDREIMNINKDKELANGVANVGTGILGGALLGSAGGLPGALAGAAVSLIGLGAGTAISMTAAEREQSAKEAMIQRSGGAVSGAGFGLMYTYNQSYGLPGGVRLMQPVTTTAADISEYVKANGYPATGRKLLKMRDNYGFYRGVVQCLKDDSNITYTLKHLMDIMNADLADGIQYLDRKESI